MIRPLLRLAPDEAAVLAHSLRTYGPALGLPRDPAGNVDPYLLARMLAGRRLELTPEMAATLLAGMRDVDAYQMRRAGPRRPRIRDLIRSGALRYKREDPDEEWKTYLDILGMDVIDGKRQRRRIGGAFELSGDCEDLGAAWAAEMVVDGWDPHAWPVVYSARPGLSHVVVQAPNYGYIDPSRLAGMGRE